MSDSKFNTDKKSIDELAERGHEIANEMQFDPALGNLELIHEMERIVYELAKRNDPTWELGVVRQMPLTTARASA